MGWSAYIETDYGSEIYRVKLPNGITGGKSFLSFITIAYAGCEEDFQANSDVHAWIREFNERSSFDFCDIMAKLDSVCYAGTTTLGNWEYKDDEYEIFLHRNAGYVLSEAEFRQTVEKMREMWMVIQELIDLVKALLGEFEKGHLRETYWYVKEYTIPDFASVLNTLLLAEERDAKVARIRID